MDSALLFVHSLDKDGLVFSGSDEEFDSREENLEYYFENYPKFKIYYERYSENLSWWHFLVLFRLLTQR
jgi:hypothetical protein